MFIQKEESPQWIKILSDVAAIANPNTTADEYIVVEKTMGGKCYVDSIDVYGCPKGLIVTEGTNSSYILKNGDAPRHLGNIRAIVTTDTAGSLVLAGYDAQGVMKFAQSYDVDELIDGTKVFDLSKKDSEVKRVGIFLWTDDLKPVSEDYGNIIINN